MHRALWLAMLFSPAFAQTAFEVASVRPDPFQGQGSVGIQIRGDRLIADHQSLASLVMFAYGVEEFQVTGGPAWANTHDLYGRDVFSVQAKAPSGPLPTRQQLQEMLQTLLKDRFRLVIHHETREMPAYELVIAKSGYKMKPADPDPSLHTVWRSGAIERYSGRKVSVADLTFLLRTQSGRPMIDKTGLTGTFDFELAWASGNPPPPDAAEPSIFTAIQEQLGLKLEPVRAPFDTIVIDSAERPSEN